VVTQEGSAGRFTAMAFTAMAVGLFAGGLGLGLYARGIIDLPDSAPRAYGLASGGLQALVLAVAVVRSLRSL